MNYDHRTIEKKWQEQWEKAGLYHTKEDTSKPKCYVLDMFPYPSGEGLHVGHPKGYIATDVYSRMKRLQGFNVLHPMGFDAFGLPAENYALKMKTNPMVMTAQNVARYKEQLSILGFDYDWSREVNTTDPKFYRWTQWIFLKMFEKGLAYESYEPINWCPKCLTGLANEDLDGDRCERCDTLIEKKPMRQWVLRITDYADRLLADLDKLEWPASIKESQRNWIGRSEGAEIDFSIKGGSKKITVFTTRPDTLFGATYVVLAPEHTLVSELLDEVSNKSEVEAYCDAVKTKTEIERTAVGKEKTGVQLKEIVAINPANNEELPVYVADYVLAHYGTGAVMAVPAHDVRDFAFAKKYHLPVKEVIIPERIDKRNPPVPGKKSVTRENVHVIIRNPRNGKFLCLKWKKHPWTTFPMGGVEEGENALVAARRELLEETGYKNITNEQVLGGQVRAEYFAAHKDQNRVSYTTAVYAELVDEERSAVAKEEEESYDIVWLDESEINPVAMTHAEMDIWLLRLKEKESVHIDGGVLISSGDFNSLSNEDAKKKITHFVKGKWTTKYRLEDWVFSRQRYWGEPIPLVHCEKCGVVAVPENELPVVLPEVESYEPTGTGESPLANIADWVNTTCPTCGGKATRETNTMPQWAGSSWYYLRYIDPNNTTALVDSKKEQYWSPVDMYVGGAEHATRHLIYARFYHKFLYDIGVVNYEEPFSRLYNVGLVMASDGRKMSKRWSNVINPDDVVHQYGADTMRVYEMFMGPFTQSVSWSTESIIGPRRFLERVWRLQEKIVTAGDTHDVESILHKTIKKVGEDIESFNFNTAISALMILVNEMEKATVLLRSQYETLLVLLSPFAPHITEEIWHTLGNTESINLAPWPTHDQARMTSREVSIAIQVNGKVREVITVPSSSSDEEIQKLALEQRMVAKWVGDQEIKKIIMVKGKLVNIVTG
jgi:leucyl-tRNA synthetase